LHKTIFNQYVDKYEKWYDRNNLVYESELNALKYFITASSGLGVEIGVGTGRFASLLGVKLGVDPAEKMVLIAKKRGVETVIGVGEKLPFRNSTLEYVIMVTTVCFLDNVDEAFKEVNRVLKRNGYVVLGFIDKNSLLGKAYEKSKKNSVFYRYANLYSHNVLIRRLKQAGFAGFEFIQTIFHDVGDIHGIEPVKLGYGEGGFVVIKAYKQH